MGGRHARHEPQDPSASWPTCGGPAPARAEDKRREHEDWLVLLVFNHLFAGLEAYVSAHLADFPGDLRLEAVPGGVSAPRVSVPIRIR